MEWGGGGGGGGDECGGAGLLGASALIMILVTNESCHERVMLCMRHATNESSHK